ncbi:hypothetical protein ACHQM5_000334 [Ranunculus cassubicifolius]
MTGAGCQNLSYELNSMGGNGNGHSGSCKGRWTSFVMPLHYPRYKKVDYETMPEWQLDCLLKQYGLPVNGDIAHKRKFAMGAFLWPSQIEDRN